VLLLITYKNNEKDQEKNLRMQPDRGSDDTAIVTMTEYVTSQTHISSMWHCPFYLILGNR